MEAMASKQHNNFTMLEIAVQMVDLPATYYNQDYRYLFAMQKNPNSVLQTTEKVSS